jgi:parallel beta-helix repeat protein
MTPLTDISTKPRWLAGALFIAAMGSLALADESRRPIYQTMTITQPGSYILTRDLQTQPTPIISIQADGVTLDLNGHTLQSSSTTGAVIQIPTGFCGAQGVTIQNGRIRGGGIGIQLQSTTGCPIILQDLQVSGAQAQGVLLDKAGPAQIRRSQIGGGTPGVSVVPSLQVTYPTGSHEAFVISDLQITGGCSCMKVDGGQGVIQNNRITAQTTTCSLAAMEVLNVSGAQIQGNTIQMSTDSSWLQSGILVGSSPGLQIANNVIQAITSSGGYAGRYGINLDSQSHDAQIAGNTVSGFSSHGIRVQPTNCRVSENTINRNGGSGISLEGSNNLAEGNRVAGNAGAGIIFNAPATQHIYRNNVLRGNTGGAVGGSPNTDGGGNLQ